MVDEIEDAGGRATANFAGVSSWEGAQALVEQAVDDFGLVQVVQGWRPLTEVTDDQPWTIESLDAQRGALFAHSGEGIPPFVTPAEQ